ncbi:MAG: carbamoyltransferase HypF, partial [Xanthomonadales bacterium]|nr:carbamoyltransferase HypF [Xanthomonadales bacterium]
MQARKIILSGIVQGVGFRPFIYRHAQAHKLHGWARNSSGRVEVHVQGDLHNLDEFTNTLLDNAPDLSRPVLESVCQASCSDTVEFLILPSQVDADADIHLPADLFTCNDCLRELNDPGNRRYRYPFINCTQCGPRYTLIEALPYDRPNTSMSGFPLCEACHAEYTNPLDRRYHAEPIACVECGPELTYSETGGVNQTGNESALSAALAALRAGKVLAIKGIGGYHLVCDACNDDAVDQLRRTKPRPHKPLAVMFPATPGDELATLRQYLLADDVETQLLKSPARPIVLVRKRRVSKLSDRIAPGLNEVGAMLPYSPLHHTLLNDFGAPLVASSANISGEPVLTENKDIEQRLAHVANAFLHHDRPIVRPADDPVYRVINSRPAPIRQGRGLAPVELDLPFRLEGTVLAVGTQMKNSIALAWDQRVVVSPHIGEMDSLRSLQTFEQCISDLEALYQVKAEHIVCDAHPGYTSTRWAHRQSLPVTDVYHHHAHASAVYAEALLNNDVLDDMLVFTWDGVGLGPDGTLWGGEALAGKPGQWRRVATFRPFKLPGGERAGREPWRSAAALCWETGQDCPLEAASDPLLFSFWQQGINAPLTTAVGRLFDAAAALCGVCTLASFEGQGPMQLEALAAKHGSFENRRPTALEFSRIDDVYSVDWAPLIP